MTTPAKLSPEARSAQFGAAEGDGIVRCDACPVLCRIRPGRPGACSRYANDDGRLVRTDPIVLLARAVQTDRPRVPFANAQWDGSPLTADRTFVTGIGAGTTYPDYKPAPLINAVRLRWGMALELHTIEPKRIANDADGGQ